MDWPHILTIALVAVVFGALGGLLPALPAIYREVRDHGWRNDR